MKRFHDSEDRRASAQGCGGACFVPGTEILMHDGSRAPIERVEVGDWVMAWPWYGSKASDLAPRLVIGRIVRLRESLVCLNGACLATVGHSFLGRAADVEAFDWIAAGNLKAGDLLMNAEGEQVQLASAALAGEGPVFNLEVGDFGTFIADDYRVAGG